MCLLTSATHEMPTAQAGGWAAGCPSCSCELGSRCGCGSALGLALICHERLNGRLAGTLTVQGQTLPRGSGTALAVFASPVLSHCPDGDPASAGGNRGNSSSTWGWEPHFVSE